jgi:hypothetical protein
LYTAIDSLVRAVGRIVVWVEAAAEESTISSSSRWLRNVPTPDVPNTLLPWTEGGRDDRRGDQTERARFRPLSTDCSKEACSVSHALYPSWQHPGRSGKALRDGLADGDPAVVGRYGAAAKAYTQPPRF